VIQQLNLNGGFETTLAIEPMSLSGPNFQIVPIVVAYDAAELNAGHYFLGQSVFTPPETRPLPLPRP
jgi:hypothetical protein